MRSEVVDGMDVLAMHQVTREAAERAREEKLPTLIEARTYRYMGHSMADPIHGHYRTKEELEEQKQKDAIDGFKEKLMNEGLLSDDAWESMEASVREEVEDAVEFAEQSPEPDAGELFTDVYAD